MSKLVTKPPLEVFLLNIPGLAEQAELEAEMASLGVQRFREAAADARRFERGTDTGADKAAVETMIRPVAASLRAFVHADRGRGRPPEAALLLADLAPEVVAYIGVKVLLNKVAQTPRLGTLAVQIGTALELETRVEMAPTDATPYLETVHRDLQTRTRNAKHRAAVYAKVLAGNDTWQPWGVRKRTLAGTKVLECIVSSTGAFEVRNERRGKKTTATLVSTPRFRDWIASIDGRMELLSPDFMPCIVPPKDWEGPRGGGYHTDAFAYPPGLVKTRNRLHCGFRRDVGRGSDLMSATIPT